MNWRLLTEEIGNDSDTVRTRRYLLGHPVEVLVHGEPTRGGEGLRCGRKVVCKPIQPGTARGHTAIRYVQARDQMVVKEHARVRPGTVGRQQDINRPTEFQ